jgi:hypothetical protein
VEGSTFGLQAEGLRHGGRPNELAMRKEARPEDPDGGADRRREAEGHHELPALGVMLHLLGSVALGMASVVWAALLLFGAVGPTTVRFLFALAGFAAAVAWLVWLVRVTAGREFDDEEPLDDESRRTR